MEKILPGDKAFITEMKDWLYLFITYIKTLEEEIDSLAKLKETLQSKLSNKDISNPIIEQILNHVVTGFEDQLYRLSQYVHMWTWSEWVCDNYFT